MKIFASALLTVFATANTTYYPETKNECFKEEGVSFVQDCADLYYNECKTYKMDPKGACTFMAYSDSEIIAYSSEVEIQYWTYASVPKGMTYE